MRIGKFPLFLILMRNYDREKTTKAEHVCLSAESRVFTPFSPGVVTTVTYLLHQNLLHLLVIKKIKKTPPNQI